MMWLRRRKSSTGLSAMANKWFIRLVEIFKPYDLEQYLQDCDPKDIQEVEARIRNWERYRRSLEFGY